MRISDWSSDVCSSDLPARRGDDQLRQDGLLRSRQSRRRGGLRLAGRLHGLGAGRQGGAAMKAVTLAPGSAAGDVFVLAEPLSFWGGLDAATGAILDRWHPQCGAVLTGKVMLMERGRGSRSEWPTSELQVPQRTSY